MIAYNAHGQLLNTCTCQWCGQPAVIERVNGRISISHKKPVCPEAFQLLNGLGRYSGADAIVMAASVVSESSMNDFVREL